MIFDIMIVLFVLGSDPFFRLRRRDALYYDSKPDTH
jgi:hypothetical protein